MTHDGWLMIVCGSSYYLDLPIAILPSYLGFMTHCGWEPLQTSQYNGWQSNQQYCKIRKKHVFY